MRSRELMDKKPEKHETMEEYHVVPMDDVIEHKDDESCPCSPFIDPKNSWEQKEKQTNAVVWIHRCIKELRH